MNRPRTRRKLHVTGDVDLSNPDAAAPTQRGGHQGTEPGPKRAMNARARPDPNGNGGHGGGENLGAESDLEMADSDETWTAVPVQAHPSVDFLGLGSPQAWAHPGGVHGPDVA